MLLKEKALVLRLFNRKRLILVNEPLVFVKKCIISLVKKHLGKSAVTKGRKSSRFVFHTMKETLLEKDNTRK